MLKNFFISMLGAIAGFWISLMLFFVVGFFMIVGTAASAFINAENPQTELKDNTVMVIDLCTMIQEQPRQYTFEDIISEAPQVQTLPHLIRAIRLAKDDKHIDGIYLKCTGSSAGLATRQAIFDALKDFRSSGKWIVAYGDAYAQGDYYLATCADEIYLNPSGMVDVRGLATSIPFFKGLLDKLGVTMQVYKVGTYKSAVEPYILDNMSDANREMTQFFLSNLWDDWASSMAKNRGVSVKEVNQWADSLVAFEAPENLVDLKIVDGLKYADEVEDLLRSKTGVKKGKDLRTISYTDFNTQAKDPMDEDSDNVIAVYYACGDIVDSGQGGIAADKVVPDILALAEDDDIKALVLRVNSGGGSAFASEQIWHALEVFKSKGKTFYVSMGDYAASGGYYISCGADKIYAQPTTLTGSIGIFGMFPDIHGLLSDKLGVNIGTVTTNANGNFPSLTAPATDFQRSRLQGYIERGYDLFTRRCADGRGIPQDSIKAIAEGRVWDGSTALKLGLVDKLGGLDSTIEALAGQMHYKKYQVQVYPQTEKNFWDMLAEMPTQVKDRQLQAELGDLYPLYMEMKRLENFSPIQARMIPLQME